MPHGGTPNMELRQLIAVLLCASICSGCVFIPESALQEETPSPFRGTDLGFSASPELRLTDHTGALFELDEQRDGITLVSFMFTQCKDVCLISEADLSLIRGTLTSEESENISIISVTMDPENDDVEALAEWVEEWNYTWPHLTGERTELEVVWNAWGAFVRPSNDSQGNDAAANLNHTAPLFILDAHGRMRVLHQVGWTPEDVLHDLRVLSSLI